MNYQVELKNDVLEVNLKGRFTSDDAGSFRPLIKSMDKPDVSTVVFNMDQTEFVDSAALGLLILAKNEADRTNKKLILTRPKGYVKKVFEVSKFYSFFEINDQ